MGARPIASINSLRFGELNDNHTRWIFDGVVDGIAGYGNTLGVPTVAGEVYFSPSYQGNPLVNAMVVGLLTGDPAKGLAAGVGNKVLLAGGKTGRDGVHGATFASGELDEKSEERREAIPAGNPELEKRLIEACLEALATGHVVGMQDLGAAGLTSSSAEMASRAGTGMEMDLSLVPVKEEGRTPYEMMLSESQERMLLVEQGYEEEVRQIFTRWDIESVYIDRITMASWESTMSLPPKCRQNISPKKCPRTYAVRCPVISRRNSLSVEHSPSPLTTTKLCLS